MKWFVVIITMLAFISPTIFALADNKVVIPLWKNQGCPVGQSNCAGKYVATAHNRCMTECIPLATFNAAMDSGESGQNFDLYKSFFSQAVKESSPSVEITW